MALLCALATVIAAGTIPRDEPTVEQLKAEVSSAKVADKAKICVQIAQKQLNESDRLYAASDYEKAQGALMDVVTYAELARDYSIQSHKYEKQTEIAARGMTRKLNQILHSLGRDDQPPLEDAINRGRFAAVAAVILSKRKAVSRSSWMVRSSKALAQALMRRSTM